MTVPVAAALVFLWNLHHAVADTSFMSWWGGSSTEGMKRFQSHPSAKKTDGMTHKHLIAIIEWGVNLVSISVRKWSRKGMANGLQEYSSVVLPGWLLCPNCKEHRFGVVTGTSCFSAQRDAVSKMVWKLVSMFDRASVNTCFDVSFIVPYCLQ